MAIPWPIAGAGLASLPKPGPWMVRVKQAFGVLILGTAVYYGYLAYGLFANQWVDAAEVSSSVEEKLKAGWHSSLAEGLAVAEREGKPVLIDMWATWCKNCLTMDKTTLADPDGEGRARRLRQDQGPGRAARRAAVGGPDEALQGRGPAGLCDHPSGVEAVDRLIASGARPWRSAREVEVGTPSRAIAVTRPARPGLASSPARPRRRRRSRRPRPRALSHDEQLAFLASARIVSSRPIGKGTTGALRVVLSDGLLTHDAAFQSVAVEPAFDGRKRAGELRFVDHYRYNIAAWRLASHVGLAHMMPPTVERTVDRVQGALSWWVDDVMMDEGERELKDLQPPNPRRLHPPAPAHGRSSPSSCATPTATEGNVLYTRDWRVVMIDFTRAFRLEHVPARGVAAADLRPGAAGALRELTREHVAAGGGRHAQRRRDHGAVWHDATAWWRISTA